MNVTPINVTRAGEFLFDRDLDALDEAILAQDDAEAQAREEIQFIDVLEELTSIDEVMLMHRLLAGPKNASADIHEILKAAIERAVKLRAAAILRGEK